MKYAIVTKDGVFNVLCRHCSSVMQGHYPFPAHLIAKSLKTSMYQVRKYLRELKEDGLVESISIIEGEMSLPYKGYNLTKSGMCTDSFKKAEKEENKLLKKCGMI